jgi:signal transduction histidine kinase
MVSDPTELKSTARPRFTRAGRVHRWPARVARLSSLPPAPSPSPELIETLGLALSLTDETTIEPAGGSSVRPGEALRRLRAARDEFVGLVSHELRTPVTTIYGNARLLLTRQDAVDGALRPMLLDIVEDADRLLVIVENLLLLTRTSANGLGDREPLQLAHLVKRNCRSFAIRRGRSIDCSVAAEPQVLVEADAGEVELLLENLLGNADKFSLPDQPIVVSVGAESGEARVVIQDRGIGLGDVAPEELFAPFYRGRVARRVTSGMGLGLAVAKRIAEAQGGRVWAASREGGGAVAGFSLPLLPDAAESRPPLGARTLQASSPPDYSMGSGRPVGS